MPHQGALGVKGLAECRQRDRHVDVPDLLGDARAGIRIEDLSVGEPDVAKPHVAESDGRGATGRGFAGRRRLSLTEDPVGPTLLVDLEADHRLHQDETLDLDLAREKRQDLQLNLQAVQGGHVRFSGSRRIAEGDIRSRNPDAGKQGQTDVVAHGQRPPGRRFHGVGNLGHDNLGRNEKRNRDDGAYKDDD